MPIDYRKCLGENLRALLAANGLSAATVKAYYPAGPKAGKKPVSERTIRDVINKPDQSSGLSVDALGALASALGVEAYHLLVPGLDPFTQPVARAENWIESEVQRRLAARLRRAGPLLKTLEAASAKAPTKERIRPSAADPWPDLEAPTGSGKRKAPARGKAKDGRAKLRAK